jgi:antitoxin CptB
MISDTDYKRIYWHSRRGMLELDLILVPFVENHLRQLSVQDQRRFIALLEQEDTDLFRWLLRADMPADPELASIVRRILGTIHGG